MCCPEKVARVCLHAFNTPHRHDWLDGEAVFDKAANTDHFDQATAIKHNLWLICTLAWPHTRGEGWAHSTHTYTHIHTHDSYMALLSDNSQITAPYISAHNALTRAWYRQHQLAWVSWLGLQCGGSSFCGVRVGCIFASTWQWAGVGH